MLLYEKIVSWLIRFKSRRVIFLFFRFKFWPEFFSRRRRTGWTGWPMAEPWRSWWRRSWPWCWPSSSTSGSSSSASCGRWSWSPCRWCWARPCPWRPPRWSRWRQEGRRRKLAAARTCRMDFLKQKKLGWLSGLTDPTPLYQKPRDPKIEPCLCLLPSSYDNFL